MALQIPAAVVAAAALATVLCAAAVRAAPAAPGANVPPVPDFNAECVTQGDLVISGYCAYDLAYGSWTFQTPAREAAALQALDAAQAGLGAAGFTLPSNWSALDPDEQQFVLVDLARVAAGLPPVVAEVPALDAAALAGAQADADPQPPAAWQGYATASNWAGDAQPAVALYGYLFLDGWGGSAAGTPNIDCSGPDASGCWAHRRGVLGNYGPTGLLGVGTVAGAGLGTGSSAQIFAAYDGAPVPVRYTWAEALAAGAAGGAVAPAATSPLWPFADLAGAPWAAGAAATLAQVGVVQGTGPGAFSPGAPLSLEQFVTLLGRALGWSGGVAAPAGTDAYAVPGMAYAAAHGLLPAGLPPTAPLSRLKTATLLLAALGLPPAAAPLPYADLGGLTPADLQVLQTAVADGLLQGTGAGQLAPHQDLSRGQAAVLLLRGILLQARGGAGPATAQALGDGRILYRLGPVRLLAAQAGADPSVYWLPASGAMLADAAGAWWTGDAGWSPQSAPAWAAGASAFGSATAQLWPAGHQGQGPALFSPVVQVVAFSSGSQELLPAAPAWIPAPAGLGADPARAVADALLP